MDIFKQRKLLFTITIILIILNIGIVTVIWMNQARMGKIGPKQSFKHDEKDRIVFVLKDELGFSDEQINKYLVLRDSHRKESEKLNDQIRELKHSLFSLAFTDDYSTVESDMLIKDILDKQGRLERITYKHFTDLKNICNNEQKVRLESLLDKLLPIPKDHAKGPPPHDKKLNPRPQPPPRPR